MRDFPLIDVATSFTHFEPSHVANGFFRTAQRILDGFLESTRRGTDYLNFFVNMFSHARIISCRHFKTTKNLGNALNPSQGDATPPPARRLPANLLYKRTLPGAASCRGKIVRSLRSAGNSCLLCMRSGPGKKTNRSASQAGHGAAKRCAKQEVYKRRFGIN